MRYELPGNLAEMRQPAGLEPTHGAWLRPPVPVFHQTQRDEQNSRFKRVLGKVRVSLVEKPEAGTHGPVIAFHEGLLQVE